MNKTRMELLLLQYSNVAERKKELNTKIKEAELLKSNTEDTLRAPVFRITGVSRNNNSRNQILEVVQKILDEYQIHLDYYYRELKTYDSLEANMYNTLKCLEPHEYNVIYWRYIKGHRWETVAIKTNNSERNCYNIRDIALEKLMQSYKE